MLLVQTPWWSGDVLTLKTVLQQTFKCCFSPLTGSKESARELLLLRITQMSRHIVLVDMWMIVVGKQWFLCHIYQNIKCNCTFQDITHLMHVCQQTENDHWANQIHLFAKHHSNDLYWVLTYIGNPLSGRLLANLQFDWLHMCCLSSDM